MPQPTVYVETSVISYLVSMLSRDLIVAGHQQITQEWWETRRPLYRVFASPVVVREARRGNPESAQRRLDALRALPLLDATGEAEQLTQTLLLRGPLPVTAEADAAHIAIAAVNGIDYLLTWNCKHIANAEIQPTLRRLCEQAGYLLPALCTPEQLMGDKDVERPNR